MISDSRYADVLSKSLSKNPDIETFFSENNKVKDQINRIFPPLTFAAVERSFSIYKGIQSEKRRKLIPGNIRNIMLIEFNQFL